jgi:outer membrane protein TolC
MNHQELTDMNSGPKIICVKILTLVIIAAATLRSAGLSQSQLVLTDSAQARGLEYYISYALENNPRIKSALDDVEVKKREAELASSLPDPMIMAKTSSSEHFAVTGIGASQMIMWPGKLIAMKKARNRNAEAQEQKLAVVMASVESDVRASYTTLYSIGQTIQRQKENLQLLAQFEEVARVQYVTSGLPRTSAPTTSSAMAGSGLSSAGNSGSMNMTQKGTSSPSSQGASAMTSMPSSATNQSTLLKIQIEQAMLEDRIHNATIQVESERKRFRALLGGDATAAIPSPQEIVSLQLPFTDQEIINFVKEKSPQIIAMERQVASAVAMVSAAQSGYFPDFTLGVEYMPSKGGSSMDQNSGSGSWDASIALSIPLWAGKKKKEVERTKKMESSMRNELEDMKNMAIAETEILLYELRDAERRIDLYRDVLVPQSKQVVDVVQASYRSGQSSYLDIIDGQRTLLDLQLTLANEQARREIAVAGIVRVLGGKHLISKDASGNPPVPHQIHVEEKQ